MSIKLIFAGKNDENFNPVSDLWSETGLLVRQNFNRKTVVHSSHLFQRDMFTFVKHGPSRHAKLIIARPDLKSVGAGGTLPCS